MADTKHIFWDQDDTILRRPIGIKPMVVNPTALETVSRFASMGYVQHFLSAKCEDATKGYTELAGLDGFFSNYFDSRKYTNAKSLSGALDSLGLTGDGAKSSGIYIGNNIETDIVADISGFVHILDPLALVRNFGLYERIIDALQEAYLGNFSQAFEQLWHRKRSISIGSNNILLSKQKLPRNLREEVGIENFQSYIFYVKE